MQHQEFLLSDFISKKPKNGGLTLGFIASYIYDSAFYLIKIEQGAEGTYDNLNVNPEDMIVKECLTSDLIRAILGPSFAAVTLPVKIDCQSVYMHTSEKKTKCKELDSNETGGYCLASKILAHQHNNSASMSIEDPDCDFKINMITNLLNLNDVKSDHFITYTEQLKEKFYSRKAIIDCSGDFTGFCKSLSDFQMAKTWKEDPLLEEKNLSCFLEILEKTVTIPFNEIVKKYQPLDISERCRKWLKTFEEKVVPHLKSTLIPEVKHAIQARKMMLPLIAKTHQIKLAPSIYFNIFKQEEQLIKEEKKQPSLSYWNFTN